MQEAATLTDVGGQRSGPACLPAHQVGHVGELDEVGGAAGVPDHRDGRVVLQPLAHTSQVGHHVDAVLAQVGGRSDAGEHQQVRAVHGTTAQQHLARGRGGDLAATAAIGHAGGPVALDDDPGREGAGLHVEVVPAAHRLQVRRVGRPAPAVAAGHLVAPGALLLGAVEVVGRLHAGADRALHPQVGELVGVAPVLDVERPVLAVVRRTESGVVLCADEVGQDVVVPPPGRAVLVAPGVVVRRVPADVDVGVHRRAAAERLHPWPVGPSVVQLLLLGRRVVPVPARLEQRREGSRDRDLVGLGLGSGLQQQHANLGVLGEPGGQHGPRTSGADDDVVMVSGRAARLGHQASRVLRCT